MTAGHAGNDLSLIHTGNWSGHCLECSWALFNSSRRVSPFSKSGMIRNARKHVAATDHRVKLYATLDQIVSTPGTWPKHRHGWRCVRCFLIGHAALSGPCPRCPHRVD